MSHLLGVGALWVWRLRQNLFGFGFELVAAGALVKNLV
jgi:hypothetical protein